MLKQIKLSILFFTLLLFSACTHKEKLNTLESDISQESISKEQKSMLTNGYQIGNYRFLLTEEQKKSSTDQKIFINNNFFKTDFLAQEKLIDNHKKINIILYSMHYSKEEERYTFGTFFVNTSNTLIQKINLTITPKFKNIGDAEPFKTNLYGSNFTELPPKGVIVQSISGGFPLESADLLMQTQPSDISFEISDLEINGEKVDNSNEH